MELDTAEKILEWAHDAHFHPGSTVSRNYDKETAEFLAECVRLRAEFDRVTGPNPTQISILKWAKSVPDEAPTSFGAKATAARLAYCEQVTSIVERDAKSDLRCMHILAEAKSKPD